MSRVRAEDHVMQVTHRHARAVTEAIHDGLLAWVRQALTDAGLDQDVTVLDRFPSGPVERPLLIVFPFRLGPEKMLDHNDAGRSLMNPARGKEPSTIPDTWRDLGQAMGAGLQDILPEEKVAGRKIPSRRPRVSALPPALEAWYLSQDERSGWIERDASGELRGYTPNLWWYPSYPIDIQYILSGVGPNAHAEGEALPLLPAMTAVRTAVHLDSVLELTLPAVPAPESLWGYITALALSLPEDGEVFPDELEEKSAAARERFSTRLGIVPAHHLDDDSVFSFMRALGRPMHATICLKIRAGLGHRVAFEPGGDAAPPNLGRRPGGDT
ncbi:MAG: hypothetical protein H6739_34830 [Alphaproteobacteria bacterium]|nr:hypothetical protein [Alphaproteobacteria bacterium]